MTKELRMTATPMQIRDGDEKHPTVIEGYALKFDRKSEIMGGGEFSFREHIDRHALPCWIFPTTPASWKHPMIVPMAALSFGFRLYRIVFGSSSVTFSALSRSASCADGV